MKRLLLGIAVSLACSAAWAAGEPISQAPDRLLIRDVTVVSADRPRPLRGMDVLVGDGVIKRVGRNLTERGATEIDGSGKYLIPGLIDSHVHVYHATGLKPRYADDHAALYDEFIAQQPSSFLYFGYTTLIELNADADANAAFRRSEVHPRLLHCSQGVVLADGFMTLDLPEGPLSDFYPNFLHDPSAGGRLPPGANPEQHTPEAVVARVAEAGGICVKLYYEEALWWPGERPNYVLPSADILRRVDRAANAAGLVTLLHATTPAGHRIALESGIDILAHGLWEWPGISYTAPEVPAEVQDLLDLEARRRIGIQPTVQTLKNTASLFDPVSLEDPRLAKVLPAPFLAYLRTGAQAQRADFLRMFGDQLAAQSGAAEPGAMILAAVARYQRQTGRLDRKGARLLFGTDTAVGGFGWGNPPGLNGYREMRAWAEGGVSLRSIFEAATLRNAQAFGLSDAGRIAPGMRADMLLLDSNPLETVEAYDRIDMVIVGGRAYDRERFAATH